MFKLFKMIKKPVEKTYPFDVEKAYLYRRSGLMTGASCRIDIKPEGVLEYYSYPVPPREMECGMRDRGAHLYFVGLKEGVAEVKLIYYYPTCPQYEEMFTLQVDSDGRVAKID